MAPYYAASLGTFSAGAIHASIANAQGLNAPRSWLLSNGTATGEARKGVFGGGWGVELEDGGY